ncbi:hypothetical protein HanPSC8_Chr08g0321271 [Helianthus annuus]|nr:hypothetical protein HanPSC8_Chr08g0321271 [Helianthus annuus]
MKLTKLSRINLLSLNIIHLLNSSFNLLLISTNINNKHQSIIILNLLHCRLSSQRILQNLVMIKLVSRWSTDARVLRVSISLQCSRTVKRNLRPDLLRLLLER